MNKFEDSYKFLESWSYELSARAERVRQLIGDRHWLTDGHHKEIIIKEFLERYAPKELTIGSGFIKELDSDLCSTEIDILISDLSKHPAYFNEGGVQIIPTISAVAYLEVKSRFSSNSLSKALDAIQKNQNVLKENAQKIWRGICFITTDKSFDDFVNLITLNIRTKYAEKIKGTESKEIYTLPTCIGSISSYIAFPRLDYDKQQIVINFFDAQRLSTAIMICDLLEHFRVLSGSVSMGKILESLEKAELNDYRKEVLELKNE